MKKTLLSALILIISIMLFSPLVHAEGDPGFTVYNYTATDVEHTMSDTIDLSKVTIFVDGLLINERGVSKSALYTVSNDEGNALIITEVSSTDTIRFDRSDNGGDGKVIVNELSSSVVIIYSDDPDTFNAWGYEKESEPYFGVNENMLLDIIENDISRLSIYSNGRLSFYNALPTEDFVVDIDVLREDIYFMLYENVGTEFPLDVLTIIESNSSVDNTFNYSNVIIISPELVYEPIQTIETVIGTQNFNVSPETYGTIEIEGLYSLSDIQLLVLNSQPFIIDGEITDNSQTTGFDTANLFIENGILKYDSNPDIDLIWVTPGKLHINGLAANATWGFDDLFGEMPMVLEYVYRVPGITGTAAFVTNVDNPISEEQIRASIAAFDETDGDISSSIVVTSDNYTANKNTVGSYNIVYSVTDSSENTVNFTVTVLVKDIEKPVINLGEYDEISISYTDTTFNYETYHSNFTIIDNYDDLADLTITADPGTFDGSVGTSTITYTVEDTSGNIETAEMTINVIDDVAPTFTGPSSFSTTLTSGLTLGTILSQFTATDFVDGARTNYITVVSDGFSPNKNTTGVYEIVIRVGDTSGNYANKTIEVTVTDDVLPVFYVTSAFISVAESVTLSWEDIIRILYVTGQIESTENYTMTYNSYHGNENVEGVYSVTVSNGVHTLTLAINVDATIPIIYAVQFNVSGGSFVANSFVTKGQAATQPEDPIRDGYRFEGWYTDSMFINEMDWDGVITDDMMLYAKWVPVTATDVNTYQYAFYLAVGLIAIGIFFLATKKLKKVS